MKRLFFVAIVPVIFTYYSCEEIGPAIDFTETAEGLIDTSFLDAVEAPQDKIVLMEEFTGVQCVNCPQGHEVTAQLLIDHPEDVAVVALHNFNSCAYTFSNQELCTIEAFDIDDLLGPAVGWPIGSVDRTVFPSESQILTTIDKWSSFVQDHIDNETPPVNIYLDVNYDSGSRMLSVISELRYTSDVSGTNRLSIMISESEIIDPQLGLTGIDTFYVHEHAVRKMLTPSTGTVLSETLEEGRVFIKEFELEVPIAWNEDHLEVVAFVHQSGDNKIVLQAAKKHVE